MVPDDDLDFWLGISLLAAQVLAGLGTNGVSLGKRDLTEAELRGFFDDLWNNALRPPLENALSGRIKEEMFAMETLTSL